MKTNHIDRLLGLLELAGQTTTVRAWPPEDSGSSSHSIVSNQETTSFQSAPWYAHLYVQQGHLHFCTLFSAQGEKLLTGQEALSYLQIQGPLLYETFAEPSPTPPQRSAWQHTRGTDALGMPQDPPAAASHSHPPPTAPPPSSQAPPLDWTPVRTQRGVILAQSRPDEQLDRYIWRVLALVDGQRRVRDIIAMLGWHPSEVLNRLQDLYRNQLIR